MVTTRKILARKRIALVAHDKKRKTADFILTSPLMLNDYNAKLTDYTSYLERKIQL